MKDFDNKEDGISPKNRRETFIYNQWDIIKEYQELIKEDPESEELYQIWINRELQKRPGEAYEIKEFEKPLFGKQTYNITRIDDDGNVYGKYETGHLHLND